MQDENISKAIVIVQIGMTPSAKQVTSLLCNISTSFYQRFFSILLLLFLCGIEIVLVFILY